MRKTKKEVVSEFRRSEILNAARAVFARNGFSRGIVDEIAREAGVAKGTVYLYFPSKEDIYYAVLDCDMRSLARKTLERIDAAESLKAKIRAFVLSRLENSEIRREMLQLVNAEPGGLTCTRSQYREWLKEPVVRLASAIEKAGRSGEIRRVPSEQAAWAIADMTRGVIQRRLIKPSGNPPANEAEFLVKFIWAALEKR
jgi:AcrR family transcriptional regulator